LKYSQLIQILRINPGKPAIPRFAAAIAARINRDGAARNRAKQVTEGAKAGFAAPKTVPAGRPALYAALTLSRSSAEIDAGNGRALGKTRDAVHPCGQPIKKTGRRE
jgi:hypothetical protein